MAQLNTKEKCTLRDLIKEEIKSLDKAEDGYGQYRYEEYEYCTFLLKLGRKLKLDAQQKVKATKLYTRIRWEYTYCCHNLNLIVPQFYASIILNIKIKRIYNVLFICVATTYDNNVYSSSSVNLLNNLQGGKMTKRNKLSKQEKKILGNYEALRGIKENTILSGGIAKKRKANLDEYDKQGYEDNQHDIDFGLDNYNKE